MKVYNEIKFVVPYAVDNENRLYNAKEAEKGKKYFCPACGSEVILHKGEIKTPHFAHKVNVLCSNETVLHKTAKLLIQRVICEWKENKSKRPVVLKKCVICDNYKEIPLTNKVGNAVLEYKMPGGYIVDVGLVINGAVQGAVEIKVHHKVSKEKAADLKIPFIELDAEDIIENPYVWKPIEGKNTFAYDKDEEPFQKARTNFVCDKCKKTFQEFKEKALKISQESGVELPKDHYYRYGITKCWKCEKEILVFTWPDKALWDSQRPKAKFIPKTIRYSYTEITKSKYWVNTCPYCKAVQGDWFLHAELEGPFFAIDGITQSTYENDMLKIAHHTKEDLGLL